MCVCVYMYIYTIIKSLIKGAGIYYCAKKHIQNSKQSFCQQKQTVFWNNVDAVVFRIYKAE